jgi:hypothetical protein
MDDLRFQLQVIASRVEAAVKAYLEVRNFTDESAWREGLLREKVSAIFRLSKGVLSDLHLS